MKSIYELSIGATQYFVAADDEQDAKVQGEDPKRFPDIHYLPFRITKVEVPGYSISIASDEEEETVTAAPRRGRRPAS